MRQQTLNILLVLNARPLKNGEHQIYIRVTIDGQSDQTSIKRSIDKKLWNQSKGVSKGKDRNSVEINEYIAQLKDKARMIHRDLLITDSYISPKDILVKLFSTEEKVTVLAVMKREIDRMESLIGIDYEYVTINRYHNCYRCVEATIRGFYRKEDITFHELSIDFVRALEDYLKIERQLKQSTLVRYMKCFKKITNMALDHGWMKKNPFAGTKFRQASYDPVFLTREELDKIEQTDFKAENMNLAKNMFLFSCYTGLAFIDAKELQPKDIFRDNNGKLWIRKIRRKMKKDSSRCIANVPLLYKAEQIIEKYRDHPKCVKNGVCLPIFCNQTMNTYLKTIADVCGIEKNLSTHLARHTFATTFKTWISLLTFTCLRGWLPVMGNENGTEKVLGYLVFHTFK